MLTRSEDETCAHCIDDIIKIPFVVFVLQLTNAATCIASPKRHVPSPLRTKWSWTGLAAPTRTPTVCVCAGSVRWVAFPCPSVTAAVALVRQMKLSARLNRKWAVTACSAPRSRRTNVECVEETTPAAKPSRTPSLGHPRSKVWPDDSALEFWSRSGPILHYCFIHFKQTSTFIIQSSEFSAWSKPGHMWHDAALWVWTQAALTFTGPAGGEWWQSVSIMRGRRWADLWGNKTIQNVSGGTRVVLDGKSPSRQNSCCSCLYNS